MAAASRAAPVSMPSASAASTRTWCWRNTGRPARCRRRCCTRPARVNCWSWRPTRWTNCVRGSINWWSAPRPSTNPDCHPWRACARRTIPAAIASRWLRPIAMICSRSWPRRPRSWPVATPRSRPAMESTTAMASHRGASPSCSPAKGRSTRTCCRMSACSSRRRVTGSISSTTRPPHAALRHEPRCCSRRPRRWVKPPRRRWKRGSTKWMWRPNRCLPPAWRCSPWSMRWTSSRT